MKNNRNTTLYYFTDPYIEYDTKWIKKKHSVYLFWWIFLEITLYILVIDCVEAIAKAMNADDFLNICNVVLYLVLYIVICVTALRIKQRAHTKNGNRCAFLEKEVEMVMLSSIVITAIYYFALSLKEHSTAFVPFLGMIANLFVGFLYSLSDGLACGEFKHLLRYLKNTFINAIKSCFVSFPFLLSLCSFALFLIIEWGWEYKRHITVSIIAVISFFCIFVLAICMLFMHKLLSSIKKRTIDKNVLLLEYTSDSSFSSRIVRALCNSGAEEYKATRKSDIHRKQYDVVIIVNALAQNPQFLVEARKYLRDGGVIIAPAHTSHRKNTNRKSKLISSEEYISLLEKRGCVITRCFFNRLVGITYVEISNH